MCTVMVKACLCFSRLAGGVLLKGILNRDAPVPPIKTVVRQFNSKKKSEQYNLYVV